MIQNIYVAVTEHHIIPVVNVPLVCALPRDVRIGAPFAAKRFKPVAEILAAVCRLMEGAA